MKAKRSILRMVTLMLSIGLFSCSDAKITDDIIPDNPETVYQRPLTVDNNVVAHRGAFKKSKTPDNSLAALWDAINLRLYASECDIHITKDGKVIVFHDDVFHGLDIDKSTYEELKAKGKLANGEELPLLEDFIEAVMQGKYTKLWVDVKSLDAQYGGNESSIRAGEAAAEIVRRMKAKYFVEFIVGREEVYKKCLAAAQGDFPVAYMGDLTPTIYQTRGYTWTNQIITSFYPNNASKIADFKSRNIRVSAYNADDVATTKWFIEQKVDQICSNDPEMVLRVLRGEL